MKTLRNDLSASKTKVGFTLSGAVCLGTAVAAMFPMYIPQQSIMVALSVVSGLVMLKIFLAEHHYFWFLVEQQKVKVRFYSVHSFLRKHQAIEIPLDTFKGYEIKKTFLKKQLVLKQRVKNQTATYPPVSIATLSRAEYNKLIAMLNELAS